MRYLGSKNRVSKELIPIIQSYITDGVKGYLEPFVGGGNVIDKISCDVRIGYDVEPYVIACLSALRDGWEPPKVVTEREYNDIRAHKSKYPPELVGYCGYQLSFAGTFFGGYRRDRIGERDYCAEAYNYTQKQIPLLKGIQFEVKDYRKIDMSIKDFVIYCDPPYRGAAGYKVRKFNYSFFYWWCQEMAKNNIVLVSEYHMPKKFECIWSKPVKVNMSKDRVAGGDRVEKLFKVEGA